MDVMWINVNFGTFNWLICSQLDKISVNMSIQNKISFLHNLHKNANFQKYDNTDLQQHLQGAIFNSAHPSSLTHLTVTFL